MRNKNPENRKPFAKKSFGQNFLVDQNYIEKIIAALNPQADETIVEIGAGRGALTENLIARAGKVVAIELDRDLIPLLHNKFGRFENFQLVEQDALKVDFLEISKTENCKLKLVANLPYYISTAILQKLIEQRGAFSEMILMFQREVARRITAAPGDSERGFLTVLVEANLTSEKLFDISPQAFRPSPKVWSSVVRLITKENREAEFFDEILFRKLLNIGFSQKRKTILNNLKNLPNGLSNNFVTSEKLFDECGIDAKRRAETLTLGEWLKIMKLLDTA